MNRWVGQRIIDGGTVDRGIMDDLLRDVPAYSFEVLRVHSDGFLDVQPLVPPGAPAMPAISRVFAPSYRSRTEDDAPVLLLGDEPVVVLWGANRDFPLPKYERPVSTAVPDMAERLATLAICEFLVWAAE